jgi:hypothetical protein
MTTPVLSFLTSLQRPPLAESEERAHTRKEKKKERERERKREREKEREKERERERWRPLNLFSHTSLRRRLRRPRYSVERPEKQP